MLKLPPASLHHLLPRWLFLPAALVFAGLGVGMARAVLHAPEDQVADLTLRLAALLTVPVPPLLLQLLTTPPHAATRRMLGEPATAVVAASQREALRWLATLACTPLAVAVTALALDSSLLLHVAATLSATLPLVAALSFAAMLHGLRLMAGGRQAGWAAVGGGGAFGPAEGAPLLYLPAFALIAGLTPVALLAAVWNARPEWLTTTVWQFLPVVGLLLAVRIAASATRDARPHLHAGLRAAEAAHASRFAQADGLSEPPSWLTLGAPDAPLAFLARAWHRRWPLSGPATIALSVVVAALVPLSSAPSWALFLLGGGFGAIAHSRTLALHAEPAWRASQWLGLPTVTRRAASQRLSLGLSLPALSLALLLLWYGAGPGLLGLAVGTAIAAAWRGSPLWPHRTAWLIFTIGLIASVVGAT